ncbi:MAG: AAA family ATPase [bacterium]
MFIHRFEVQGFKNFVEPVVLDELGEINVIHGDNNVGKSNLLEAMHLFFAIANEWVLPSDSKPFGIGTQELVQMDHPQQTIFGLQSADPIIFDVLVAIDPDVVPIKLWEEHHHS